MRGVGRENSKPGEIEIHHFHHLAASRIRHAGVRLAAIGNRLLQRSYEVRFAGLALLDRASGLGFASSQCAEEVLRIGEVADQLQAMGSQITREDFMNLALSYAGDEARTQALVGLMRPALDYQFFNELTNRIIS